jgi:phage-related protein
MPYAIEYYNEDLQQEILTLPPSLLARYISLTDRMVDVGPHLGEPHTKGFGKGLFELRLRGAEGIARVFFCTRIGQRIVMLHCFVKKDQKTPKRHKTLAEKRLKEVRDADA